jgi:hypothetical protein
VAIVGSGVAVLGAVLPWLRTIGVGTGVRLDPVLGFDVPVTMLFSDAFGADGFGIGYVVLLLALASVGLSLRAEPSGSALVWRRVFGAAVAVLPVWFAVRLQSQLGFLDVDLTELVGVGVPVTVLGGIVVLAAPGPRRR